MEEVDQVIDNLKTQLNADKSQSRAKTISYLLEVLRVTEGETLVSRLVYNGIVNDLIQNVTLLSRRDFLECLKIIIKANAFYTNCLVNEVIERITQYEFNNSTEEATLTLNIILSIVTKVFVDFTESQGISLIEKHEDSLLSFMERAFFDSFSILFATKLLTFLIQYSSKNFKNTYIVNVKGIFDKMMTFLLRAEDISDSEKLKIICCTSLSVANFCNQIEEKELFDKLSGSSGVSSIAEIPQIKLNFIASIKRVTCEFLLPFPKTMDLDSDATDLLIEFLLAAINLQEIKDEKLFVDLMSHGFLKYLLKLTILHHTITLLKNRICHLISEIIVGLKDYLGLMVDDWQGGILVFQKFLLNGLESLPADSKQWEDILKLHSCQANSLLILLFCHYIGTNELYIVTQKALSVKLTSVVGQYSEPIFLKAIWLLISATALASKVPISNYRSYSKAVKSLAISLQSQKIIELAYTHNEDLLLHAIQETDFPDTLKIKTVSLWLDNSKSDEEYHKFIQECLVQNYDELKIVKLIMDVIHKTEMKNSNNALKAYVSLLKFKKEIPDDATEFIWKTIAEDLSQCSHNKHEILKTVLRVTATLPSSMTISNKIIRKCAIEVCKVLLRDGGKDMILKTLLITATTFILRQSVDSNNPKVSEIYLKNDLLLKEIFNSGFSLEETTLTEMCLRTLTCLMVCQILYDIKCNTVYEVRFADLKNLLFKLKEKQCSPIFGIEFVKFILRNKCDNPVIRLKVEESGNYLDDIYHIYLMIHLDHNEFQPEEEFHVYQCLSDILHYCYHKKLNMTKFFMCPVTPSLMKSAVKDFVQTGQLNYYFLNFSTVWLEYLKFFISKEEHQGFVYHEKSQNCLMEIPKLLAKSNVKNETTYNFIKAIQSLVK